MRILSAGDLHGDSGLAKKLADKAAKENVDIVILCGDLTEGDEKTDNLIGPFLKRHKKVLIVPGNHESVATADFLAQAYGIKNLHGYSVRLIDPVKDGKLAKHVGIFGCSGVNLGIHQITDKETYDLLAKGHKYIQDSDVRIMVTHIHPAGGTAERLLPMFEGSRGIRRAIDKFHPDILLCSHIHEMEGLEEKIGKTKVITVGTRGKVFDI
jgi:Icc-related predicted phosphoesterase